MQSYDIERQKPAVRVFTELDKEIDRLFHETCRAGHIQRNALITHVYSGYNNHEDLMAKKARWEKLGFHERILRWLFKTMTGYRDLYGYFPEYGKMILEIDGIIAYAIKREEYEIASLLTLWRNKLPDP
jgi:hypothetical protein